MAGRTFAPSPVSVRAGGTVTFANDDDRAHTVTANDGSFNSGVLNAGSRWSRRFPNAGTFRYACAIHPDMTGTVTVPAANGAVPPPAPAAPGPASGPGHAAPAPAAPAPPVGRPGAAGPVTVRVDVVDFGYAPSRATARVGDTVTWVNTGASPHTVTANGAPFGASLLAPGATYRWSPATTGTWTYVCTFHPQMTGSVVALPRSAALPANAAPARGTLAATTRSPSPGSGAVPGVDLATDPVGTPSRQRSLRPVATASPLVAWSLWGSVGLVVFLVLAWWRGREPAFEPRREAGRADQRG
jgi:plastocyanin